MKKKFQAAENYLTAQAKEFGEKINFVKSHGKFFEKVMYPLENQKEKCCFIIENFQRSALQFPFPSLPEKKTVEAREWPCFLQFKNREQLMTQEKMEAICQSIVNDAYSDNPNIFSEYVIIDFEKGYFTWHEMTYLLNDAVVEIEIDSLNPLEGQKDCFEICLGDRLKGSIYMQDKDGFVQAFLKITGDDGKNDFFELKHFSMLYLLHEEALSDENEATDCKKTEINSIETPVAEHSTEDGKVGMFTLFSKTNHMLFVTTY